MSDEHYMQRAIDLALNGLGAASPNPMVGCVIVHNNIIIGESWHKKFGDAHAEVNAFAAVKNKNLIAASTVYISLEPCSFHGKTPACTDLIVRHKPKKVVIASKDPNPKVSGKGIEILQKAGIEVSFGLLEDKAMILNKRFFVSMAENRPFILLKWAQTADGFIARKNYNSKWISNEYSRQLVHKWRTEEDAILIGRNTAHYDNPHLTARDWQGRDPIKVIIDPELTLESNLNVFAGDTHVYVFNTKRNEEIGNIRYVKVNSNQLLTELLAYLYEKNIGSILVEGGTQTLASFIKAGLWDEARIFTATCQFNEGIKAPLLAYEEDEEQNIMGDRLSITYNPNTKSLWQKSYQ